MALKTKIKKENRIKIQHQIVFLVIEKKMIFRRIKNTKINENGAWDLNNFSWLKKKLFRGKWLSDKTMCKLKFSSRLN